MPRRRRLLLLLFGCLGIGTLAVATTTAFGSAGLGRSFMALWTPPMATTSWDLLGRTRVEPMKDKGGAVRAAVSIPPEVEKLNGREIKLVGFMFPVDAEMPTRRFLLVELPVDCPFCFANWSEPSRMAEIWTDRPVDYVLHQVGFAGRLELQPDEPAGFVYRLLDARPAG